MRIKDIRDALETGFRVTLDDLTVARLMELADVCHAPPAVVIAAIVRDVLEDDARAHGEAEPVSLQ
jgi:hypothetical protein